ncbi:phenylacetate--CoA ligase family protein [Micromonospora chokoriensis]
MQSIIDPQLSQVGRDGPPYPDVTDPHTVRRLVERVTALRSLRDRYPVPAEDLTDLAALPVLSKDDFRLAAHDLLAQARAAGGGALVFGSGGTTAAPKLSLIPSAMYVTDILRFWTPLTSADVLVNLNNAGELGSMYPFYNMLAHESGAVVVPLGSLDGEQTGVWLDFMDEHSVTAAGSTPSQLVRLLEFCESAGRRPPALRKVVWTGESFPSRAAALTRRMLPDVELHGVYGSTETWVIGHNGPDCASDTFHVLPYQHIELVDGAVVVTNTHPRTINPILRYRVGDRGEFVSCSCGRSEPALRVLGRADQQVKFRTILVTPEEIAEVGLADPDVRAVQLVLRRAGDPTEQLELRLVRTPGADDACVPRVRRAILTQLYRIGFELGGTDAFVVRAVDALTTNPRTNKTPLLVHEPTTTTTG